MQLGPAMNALILAGKRLDARGIVAGTEGNLSARMDDGSMLITRSGAFKGELSRMDLLQVDLQGRILVGEGKMSSESNVHMTAYRLRPDVNAVVHAHPPAALALMLRGEGLEAVPLAEAAYAFGSVPTTRFAVPGTPEGGEVIAEWITSRDAVLLDRHGAVTVGRTVEEALARMETLDAISRTVLMAGDSGSWTPLEISAVERVADAAVAAGAREEAVVAWRAAMMERLR